MEVKRWLNRLLRYSQEVYVYISKGYKTQSLGDISTELGCKTSEVYLPPGDIPEGKNPETFPFFSQGDFAYLREINFFCLFQGRWQPGSYPIQTARVIILGTFPVCVGWTVGSHYNACGKLDVGNGAFLDINNNNWSLI